MHGKCKEGHFGHLVHESEDRFRVLVISHPHNLIALSLSTLILSLLSRTQRTIASTIFGFEDCHHFWEEYSWGARCLDSGERLGVVELIARRDFGLRYSFFFNLLCIFGLVPWRFEFEFWVFDSVIWGCLSLSFWCYYVSSMLGFRFLTLNLGLEAIRAVFGFSNLWFLGFLRCWSRSCSWWSRSTCISEVDDDSGIGLIAINKWLDREPL